MDDDPSAKQFEAAVQRAGLSIAPERRKTMLNVYLQIVAWSEIVHDYELLARIEPSNVFDPRTDSADGSKA